MSPGQVPQCPETPLASLGPDDAGYLTKKSWFDIIEGQIAFEQDIVRQEDHS